MHPERSTVRCSQRITRWQTAGRFAALLAAFALLAGTAVAQLPQTRLYAIAPMGGQAGTTVELKVTNGDDIDELSALQLNHPGIRAVQKMQESGGKQTPVANTFLVTIAEDVPPGLYEVRARGVFGLSNPRTFVVGEREEVTEAEANNTRQQAQEIKLDSLVNGVTGGNADVDFFRFEGKAGQRVIATCRAARIDSRLSAVLEVYDAGGRRLGYGRENVRQDPLVDVTLPADGPYFVKLYDFLYRGGAEYGYRLSVGTDPYIDFVMPPSGLPGTTGTFTLYGRNLPGGTDAGVSLGDRPLQKLEVSISLPEDPATLETVDHLSSVESVVDAISYVHRTPQGSSNPVLIYLATAPVVIEQEPNDEPAQSQKVSVPAEVVGQFQSRGDVECFTFQAKGKEVYYIEVFGQRNGVSADPYFVLERVTTNDQGAESLQRITTQDDDTTNLAPNVFDTLTDDPMYRFQVPADGTYRVTLRDRYYEVRGGPELVYRLSIRRERPDFRLLALPTPPSPNNNLVPVSWSVALRKGDNVKVDVLAFRRDGFDGTIDVHVEGLPKGVECKGASLGAKQNIAPLIFTAAEDAPEWSGSVRVVGKARIEDPAKQQALLASQSAVKSASEGLSKLRQELDKANDKLTTANDELAKAKQAAGDNPDDQGLQTKLEQAQKAADAAQAAAKQAEDAHKQGAQKLAEAQNALKKAEADYNNAVRKVTRAARVGTIAWNAANNAPGVARVARRLGLSVLEEQAPYHVTTDVFRVEANQSRQILVPVKLTKRHGFDNNVNLTFTGLPNNTNIQIANKPIPKGQDEQLLRIFVNNNAAVGTYTLYLRSQAQVPYKRNAQRAERTKAEAAEAAQRLKQAQDAAKQAAQQRDEAGKKAQADAEALKKAREALAAAEKKAAGADAALKKATDEKATADKGDDEDAKQAAAKALAEAQQALKKATEEAAAAKKSVAEAEAAAKASAEAKAKADAAANEADEQVKALDAAKKAADKRAQDAANAAKPKNTNCYFPSTPIVITVKPGPATLSASVPGGGNLKKGQQLEVKVTVKRTNDFEGPVTLSLPAVPGVEGVTAEPVTIPADQSEGVLAVQAAADATEGQLANMVVRATMDFDGKAAVDTPINLKVSK